MQKSLAAFGLIALLTAAGSASAMQPSPLPPPPSPYVISNPDWVRMPNGEELVRLYPRAAQAQHAGGQVRMKCHVQADGSLADCSIMSECPAGLGFGQATLDAAPYFRMRPTTVDGRPVGGGVVFIPIAWQFPDGSPPPRCGMETPQASSAPPPPIPVPPRRPAIISNPDWLRLPSGDALAALYPQAAKAKRIAGRTRMQCEVLADGTLSGCVLIAECPLGLGFGWSTIQAAPYFQMRPKTVDGAPVSGGKVVIPMAWRVADGPPPDCQLEAPPFPLR